MTSIIGWWRALGPAGAATNAAVRLAERRREDQIVWALERRLQDSARSTGGSEPSAA